MVTAKERVLYKGEKQRMDNIYMYYFSGTGNTLYLVNQLKECISEIIIIPIASLLDVDDIVIPKSKTIGFCFPNHAGHIPIPIKIFLEKIRLEGDEYLFAICNSAFSKCFAPDDFVKILKKSGCRLSAYFNLIMPDNHTIVAKDYKIPDKEEFKKCEDQSQEKLSHIKEVIMNKEKFIEKDDKPAPFPVWIDKILGPIIFFLIQKHPSILLKGRLYADSKCNSCKICEKACPANRIVVNHSRPIFDYKISCFGCYGCVNFCPVESIQVASKWFNGRSYSSKNSRYPHPYASVKDIEKQKTKGI